MVVNEGKGAKPVATKNKSSSSKSAGGQKIQAGPGGQMHKFSGVGDQKPGVSATTKHSGKGKPFPTGGPSGKMAKFTKVVPVKKA
jgi:hypothetical protein